MSTTIQVSTDAEPRGIGGSLAANISGWAEAQDAKTRDHASEIGHGAAFASSLIASRQNVSPKRLIAPGPNEAQLEQMCRAAAAAPDHGLLMPWRFVLVPQARRTNLAEVFALALVERDPGATLEQIEAAREKAHRAPLLMLAVARLGPCEPEIPMLERMVSVGCAVQNLLLCAHALGFGSSLTSGQAMSSARMRALFQLAEGEHAVCFVNVGTVAKRRPPRARPDPALFVSSL
jgi:nitroreductase